MASKLQLMNENGKVLSISSGSIIEDMILESKDFNYCIDSIKDFNTIQSPKYKDICFVKSYHGVDKDSDGGYFMYVPISLYPNMQHDGGLIIDPERLFPSAWSNVNERISWYDKNLPVNNGCWIRFTRDNRINVKWYGAKGLYGSTNINPNDVDDTLAFKNCLSNGNAQTIYIPKGTYLITDTLILNPEQNIYGDGSTNIDTNESTGSTKIVFNVTNELKESCLTNIEVLKHCEYKDLTIRCENGFKKVFNLKSPLNISFVNVHASNYTTNGSVFYSDKSLISTSWILNFDRCHFKVLDSSNNYVFDSMCTDSFFTGCYFTGGKGNIDRSSGGNVYSSCHWDRSNEYGLTLQRYGTSEKQVTVSSCYFDVNTKGGILLDNSTATKDGYFRPVINACAFRNTGAGASYDIDTYSPTYKAYGVVISNNSFSSFIDTPINITSNFQDIVIIGNHYTKQVTTPDLTDTNFYLDNRVVKTDTLYCNNIYANNLPSTDPLVKGQFYIDSNNNIKVSQG